VCGRFTLTDPDPRILRMRFNLSESIDLAEERPRYNIAPTDPVLAVRRGEDGVRDAGRLRWGLVPYWAGGDWKGPPLINARAETVDEVPMFKESFERRRCLIPADGFYEWRQTDAGKQPVWISAPDGELFAFAGLWASSRKDRDEKVYSCAIVTCEPNELLASIHNRMPVILEPDSEEAWLAPETGKEDLRGLLRPCPGDRLGVREVSDAVNDVREDGAHLLEPPMKLF
jgi:putative SOS response-associated peptidase YedK